MLPIVSAILDSMAVSFPVLVTNYITVTISDKFLQDWLPRVRAGGCRELKSSDLFRIFNSRNLDIPSEASADEGPELPGCPKLGPACHVGIQSVELAAWILLSSAVQTFKVYGLPLRCRSTLLCASRKVSFRGSS